MGILHRFRNRLRRWSAPDLWQVETQVLDTFGMVKPPEAVQWIGTTACDLHCPHCYSHAGRRHPKELSTQEAKSRLIDALVPLKRPTLVFAGGEILLRRDFAELVAYTHDQGISWALHSHGGHALRYRTLFTDYTPIMAAISVDGPREYHDEFRGRAGSLDRALAAIELLKQTGCPEVVAGTTVTRANADLIADMVPMIIDSAADSWGLHLMTPEGRGHDHRELMPTPDQLRRVASLARRLRGFIHVELDNEWGSAGDNDCFYRDDPFACGAGRVSCVVSASGELMPCTTTDQSESQGNIRDQSLYQLWTTKFSAFRQGDDSKSDTSDCWLQTRNGCSCRGAAFLGEDSIETGNSLVQLGVRS